MEVAGLFFLGHMAWGYVCAILLSGKRRKDLFIPAVLIFSVIPDSDLLISRYGMIHQTFTHSFLFWFILFSPFLAVFRLRAIPFLAAVVQHFTFGDFIFGKVMMFWPFIKSYYGFSIAMASLFDITFEIAGLVFAAAVIYFTKDLRRLLLVDVRNIPMLLPFMALVTSLLFFEENGVSIYILWTKISYKALASGHFILGLFLFISMVQGFRAFLYYSNKKAA